MKTTSIEVPPSDVAGGARLGQKTISSKASLSEVTAEVRLGRQIRFGWLSGALFSARALFQRERRIHLGLRQAANEFGQADASCASGRAQYNLTPNQSLQPTSPSSLRSSGAAAELQR